MRRFLLAILLLDISVPPKAHASEETQNLYRFQTVVTGTGETNRAIGFRNCLDGVLMRVSGDTRLPDNPQFLALRGRAGEFVESFHYRDRLEGVPIHDEQGTYDRPHDLTCLYKPETVDRLLAMLGSRPWVAMRPALGVVLEVQTNRKRFLLTADGEESPYMRDSFRNAADLMVMGVAFPTTVEIDRSGLDADNFDPAKPGLQSLAVEAGGSAALFGTIIWSDKDLGWIARWHFDSQGHHYNWEIRGVSFDDAFRNAVGGVARILSGNGEP